MVSKIIADRLKAVLVRVVSAEQFGFLPGWQILDVVDIVQENLYLIKMKKTSSFILKLDLEKAYDKID